MLSVSSERKGFIYASGKRRDASWSLSGYSGRRREDKLHHPLLKKVYIPLSLKRGATDDGVGERKGCTLSFSEDFFTNSKMYTAPDRKFPPSSTSKRGEAAFRFIYLRRKLRYSSGERKGGKVLEQWEINEKQHPEFDGRRKRDRGVRLRSCKRKVLALRYMGKSLACKGTEKGSLLPLGKSYVV